MILRRCVTTLMAWALWVAMPVRPDDAASGGCGGTAPPSGQYTLEHGGELRHYQLSVPANHDPTKPARLVLAFHGWGGDESEFLGDRTVVEESSRRGYIVVAPRGLGSGAPDHKNNSWTFRGSASGIIDDHGKRLPICDAAITPDYRYSSCAARRARNSCSWTQCQDDDVAFVRELVAHLEATLCIDTRHVFATGGSNGGMFTWELAANPASAGLFRAIAPIIGLPHRGDLRSPGARRALPVLLITGLSDNVVPPGKWDDASFTTATNDHDRYYYTGATAVVRRWSEAAGCAVAGPEKPFDTGQSAAECRAYCPGTAERWPRVLDCRAPMAHDYQLGWAWKLVLDFFDQQ